MDLEKKAVAAEKKFFFDPSNFAHVLYLALAALLVVLLAFAIIVGWRSKVVKKVPFDKHPTAEIFRPETISRPGPLPRKA